MKLTATLIRWFARGMSAYDALMTGWINRLARRPGAISAVGPPALPGADSGRSIARAPFPPVGAPPVGAPPVGAPPVELAPLPSPP